MKITLDSDKIESLVYKKSDTERVTISFYGDNMTVTSNYDLKETNVDLNTLLSDKLTNAEKKELYFKILSGFESKNSDFYKETKEGYKASVADALKEIENDYAEMVEIREKKKKMYSECTDEDISKLLTNYSNKEVFYDTLKKADEYAENIIK